MSEWSNVHAWKACVPKAPRVRIPASPINMSEIHQVLSRKYRPQLFQDVIYQDLPVNAIRNAIKHAKIGHAYIFFGPRGVGKTTIARIFAKRINCENPIDSEPCNKCNSCIEITKGISNDVLEIDAASHRGINHVRELRENVKYSPMGGKYKIYIIDEVHMLTTESFNALLKTLEEPPSHVVFILATTEYHKIPETILSRCQDFMFRKVPLIQLQSYLEELCKKEKLEFDTEGLFWIAKKGDGSVRDSLSFMEQAIVFTDSKLLGNDIRKMIGYHGIDTHINYLKSILNEDNHSKTLMEIEKLFHEGHDMIKFSWDFLEFIHTLILIKENLADRESVNFPPEDLQKMREEFKNLDIEKLNYLSHRLYEIYEKITMMKLRTSFEIKVYLEIQFRKIHFDINKPSLSGILNKINNLTELVQSDLRKIETNMDLSEKANLFKEVILEPKSINQDSPVSTKEKKNLDLESTIKEEFAGVEVDSIDQPDIK